MFGECYQNGRVVVLTDEDVKDLLPYLDYSKYVFEKLLSDGGYASPGNSSVLYLLDLQMQQLSGKLSNAAGKVLTTEEGVKGRSWEGWKVFGITNLTHSTEVVDTRWMWKLLDRRLPWREHTYEGLKKVTTLTNWLFGSGVEGFNSPIILHPPWEVLFPELFTSCTSKWTVKTDHVCEWMAEARKLTIGKVKQIMRVVE